jgi:phage baseplate assembly protein W
MSAKTPASFLGTGWSFPPGFSRGGGQVAMVSEEEDVHQSLQILLATRRGERPMQETFGCNLDAVLFEEMDQALVSRVTTLIYDAVLEHEPRVKVHAIDVSADGEAGVLRIRLDYAIQGTNSRYNMVFPFYLNEASTPGL